MRVEGAEPVADLLRALADQVELGLAQVDGHRVPLAPSLRATVEVPDDTEEPASVVDIRLVHPSHQALDVTRLRVALSHPGD